MNETVVNIFIGTPAYNSMVHTDYLHSLLSFHESKIPFTVMTIGNESLITRGRNTIVSYFYSLTAFTHLLFLDADIYLSSEGLMQLISDNKDVIGAPVALKGNDNRGNPVYNVGKLLSEENGVVESDKIGTAVFMLSRRAVNSLIQDAIDNNNTYMSNPYSRGDARNIKMYDVFKTGVENNEYLSEDFYVCKVLRELGYKIYVDTNVPTRHNGMFVFN